MADPHDLLHQLRVGKGRCTKLRPVTPLAARDDVVDRGKREALVVQVSMQHGRTVILVLQEDGHMRWP